jgi:hypothetical protein
VLTLTVNGYVTPPSILNRLRAYCHHQT